MGSTKGFDITAEAVATLRNDHGMPYDHHFETFRGRSLTRLAGLILPKEISDERIELSYAMQETLLKYDPEQVIELAGGASLYGFEWTAKHPDRAYVETDLAHVTEWKRKILAEIRGKERFPEAPNHHVLPLDVACDDIYATVGSYLDNSKRTLVIAEALPLFLDESQHERLVQNVGRFMDYFPETSYASHDFSVEGFMDSGLFGKFFLALVKKKIGSKIHKHFEGVDEGREFFASRGFSQFHTLQETLGEDVAIRYPNLGRQTPLFPYYMVGK